MALFSGPVAILVQESIGGYCFVVAFARFAYYTHSASNGTVPG